MQRFGIMGTLRDTIFFENWIIRVPSDLGFIFLCINIWIFAENFVNL